jgi:hypothetical protein
MDSMVGEPVAHGRQKYMLWTDIGGEQDTCFGEAAPLLGTAFGWTGWMKLT